MKFSKGQKLVIGTTEYTVVVDRKSPESYIGEQVICTFTDKQGCEDYYTFNKAELIGLI